MLNNGVESGHFGATFRGLICGTERPGFWDAGGPGGGTREAGYWASRGPVQGLGGLGLGPQNSGHGRPTHGFLWRPGRKQGKIFREKAGVA